MTRKKRQVHRAFTEPELRYIEELAGGRHTLTEIANRVGRPRSSIKGLFQRKGWKAKPAGPNPQVNIVTREERDRIASRFSGTSYKNDMAMRAAIAVEAGRSESVTRSICNWIYGRPVCSTSAIYDDPVPERLQPNSNAGYSSADGRLGERIDELSKIVNYNAHYLDDVKGRLEALLRDLGTEW
jgi:hypothetical protein